MISAFDWLFNSHCLSLSILWFQSDISSVSLSGECNCGEHRSSRGHGHLTFPVPVLPVCSQQHRQPDHTPRWHHGGRSRWTSGRDIGVRQERRRRYRRIPLCVWTWCHHGVSCWRHDCVSSALLDMTINQFLKSLGLEHLRDIFQREQVLTHSLTHAHVHTLMHERTYACTHTHTHPCITHSG